MLLGTNTYQTTTNSVSLFQRSTQFSRIDDAASKQIEVTNYQNKTGKTVSDKKFISRFDMRMAWRAKRNSLGGTTEITKRGSLRR